MEKMPPLARALGFLRTRGSKRKEKKRQEEGETEAEKGMTHLHLPLASLPLAGKDRFQKQTEKALFLLTGKQWEK
ncbi:MAG: hypothetical protein ACKPFE_00580, partial [Dolichospermum sp.]